MHVKTLRHRFTQALHKVGDNRHLLALGCAIWFAWRVGTNPKRITYPCQRAALAQLVLYVGSLAAPIAGICYQSLVDIRRKDYARVAGIASLVIVLTCAAGLYADYQENQLRIAGGTTIPGSILDAQPAVSLDRAVVSFNYDPDISYGSTAPFDPAGNPAYAFVWETVDRLGLGSASSPLQTLIAPGDTVLIKPNLVGTGTAVYTRPEVVRPLVDMAIAAGATRIYIGEGTASRVSGTANIVNTTKYKDLVTALSARHPEITIQFLDLNMLSGGWHWVSLGGASSFAGSGYTDYDLNSSTGTLYGNRYYQTADPQGINPDGHALGWYAINDSVLDADVVINVPKMKTHNLMMNTLSVKNLVGFTLRSTYDQEASSCLYRIAHYETGSSGNDHFFNNDIFWRAISDVSKIVLYADKEGNLQATQQRKCLNVVDAIQAMERSENTNVGGGGLPYDRHVVLASTDPVAVDAVASRVMGYEFTSVPQTSNVASDTAHPIGINDPGKIAIIGGDLDSRLNHVFVFNDAWKAYAGSLATTDFAPPTIRSVTREGDAITASVSGGLAAYLIYQADGSDRILEMTRDVDRYSAVLPTTVSEYLIRAQDEHFNTASTQSSASPAPTITAVGSSSNPSVPGQAVTFNATVNPSSATGTVQFVIDGAAFGSPVALSSGSATSTATSSLSAGSHTVSATYSGNINYLGSTGTLAGGQTVTQASALAAPTLVSPANGSTTGDRTPYLDWSKVTAATTVHYRLQVDNNADFSSPLINKTWVSYSYYTVTTSLSNGTYYWRVMSVDANGKTSAWAGPWSFKVATVAPPVPTLVSPSNGASTSDHTPYLDWSKVTASSTVHYQLQVDNNVDFSSPSVNKTWLSYSYYTVSTSLSHGTYYWRVRAVDASGNQSAWSTARSFRVA